MSVSVIRQFSTNSDAFGGLSPDQARVVLTLAQGGTVTHAADATGVHRSTIYNWFKQDPLFKQAVIEVRRERNERLFDQMRELESLALARLRRLLEDDSVPASVQLRAATLVLNRCQRDTGTEEWNIPVMESLRCTLERRPSVAKTPEFDMFRHLSTQSGASDPGAAPAVS